MPRDARNQGRDTYQWRRRRGELRAMHMPCWLCGRDIDYSLTFPDPWSFTVDHVVPLSKGGDAVDWDNLRAAHYRCNQRKGDKIVVEKPKRIAFRTSRAW